MTKHIKPETAAIFTALGFTPVDPATVLTDWSMETPFYEEDAPSTFYHAGIDTYIAYGPEVVDALWDDKLKELGAIFVVDDDGSAENLKTNLDVPLELITLTDLAGFVAQRAFNPAYFDLRIAKRCVAHAQQELSDLDGDERPTREQFRKARKTWKEAVKHLRNLAVPPYQPVVTI